MIIFNIIITKGITRINIPPGLGSREGIIIYYYSFENKDYHTQKEQLLVYTNQILLGQRVLI